jgi:8-oxo-dGTP pyrophosphatase MutT (NUDIX family)
MSASARPASTVVVLRPSAARFDVLLVHRHERLAFMGGTHVFPGGSVDAADAAPTMEDRHRRAAVRELREETGIDVSEDALVPFAHWVTPAREPRRFDTWFYLVAVRGDQQAAHDGRENTAVLWIDPAAALARGARGEIALPPPTWTTLRSLASLQGVEEAMAWARGVRVERVQPDIVEHDGVKQLTVPGDPPTRFVMERGRWVAAGA